MKHKDDDEEQDEGGRVVLPVTVNKDDCSRTQSVYIRRDDEVSAMPWETRMKKRFVSSILSPRSDSFGETNKGEEACDGTIPELATNKKIQYRLEAKRTVPRVTWKQTILSCGLLNCLNRRRHKQALNVGRNPNKMLASYLHWMFRVNFLFLFTLMCFTFFMFVIFFAGWISLSGRLDARCIRIGGEVFASAGTPFADAFSLSWTTFSTVGYGSTYPALGYQNSNPSNCFFINFICSLEALVGVLYSGFCGAILFGKILRIQSQAQVIFSDPMVVRFGSGVTVDQLDSDTDASKIPCPVLEFRIVNRLFSEDGGEIMDATLNVVANIGTDDGDPSHQLHRDESIEFGIGSDSESNTDSERSDNAPRLRPQLYKRLSHRLSFSKDQLIVDEDSPARLISKHIFSKMVLEASDHPFFKRVWLARHILDENSPILKPRIRRLIRRNDGQWPDQLNNYTGVRDSLRFNQILVSLNGISNVSASDVYSQKIYDFVDVHVGYQFVNVLYKDSNDVIGVDIDLINDVREQDGGGGEPLFLDE